MSNFRHAPVARTTRMRLVGGTGVDPHWHDEHQIVYAARGVLSVSTDRGRWIAPPTLAIWVPAGTVHEHRAYGETDLCAIGLPVQDNPLGLDTPEVLSVGSLLRELILSYVQDPDDHSAERARLRSVLLDQLRSSPRRSIQLPTPRDPRLAAVCERLRADPANQSSLAALSAEVGASERTLSRLFRAELHMTFPQWRTQLRLHQALILLAEDTPVTEVAHRCGWATPSAFIDVFRRCFGHTPGQVRQQAL